MNATRSYEIYHDQYEQHLDELLLFTSGMSWDVDRLMLTVKGDIITITRTDTGKRFGLHYKQFAGLLRFIARKRKEQEDNQ